MKYSIVILTCAGFFLVTSLNNSQADSPAPEPGLFDPTVGRGEMVNGRVRFHFGFAGPACVQYNVSWARGVRRASPGRTTFPSGFGGTIQVGMTSSWLVASQYTIPENALPNTRYYIRVQAVGMGGKRTNFVEGSFLTPPGPSIADKARVTPSPFGEKKVSATATKTPNLLPRTEMPGLPLTAFEKSMARPTGFGRVLPMPVEKLK